MGMTIDEAMNHIKYGIIEENYPLPRDLGIEACNFAIDTMRKYQKIQADYNARLKADLVAILTEIQLEIEEQVLESLSDGGDDWFTAEKVNECLDIIDKHKVESEDKE